MCPCWSRFGIWELNNNLCFHHSIFFTSTSDTFLEVDRPSLHHNSVMTIHWQFRWGTGSVRAVLDQVLTPSAAPGTRNLGTGTIIMVQSSHRWYAWFSFLKPWNTHSLERAQGRGAAPKQPCLLNVLVRKKWGLSCRPGLLVWAEGLLCIVGSSWEDKRKHRGWFKLFPQVSENCRCVS